jgi:uncharacterized protein YjlB
MGLMQYTWKNNKRDIDVKQYVYFISSYHYNWHDAMELIMVLQGEIEVSKNGKNYILEEDDMMIINSNVGHATLARKPNSIVSYYFLKPSAHQSLKMKQLMKYANVIEQPLKRIFTLWNFPIKILYFAP